jgi:hypothetical protein
MSFLARFRAVPDKDKAALVRKLMENGTPDFDYFYLVGLSTLMAKNDISQMLLVGYRLVYGQYALMQS